MYMTGGSKLPAVFKSSSLLLWYNCFTSSEFIVTYYICIINTKTAPCVGSSINSSSHCRIKNVWRGGQVAIVAIVTVFPPGVADSNPTSEHRSSPRSKTALNAHSSTDLNRNGLRIMGNGLDYECTSL